MATARGGGLKGAIPICFQLDFRLTGKHQTFISSEDGLNDQGSSTEKRFWLTDVKFVIV